MEEIAVAEEEVMETDELIEVVKTKKTKAKQKSTIFKPIINNTPPLTRGRAKKNSKALVNDMPLETEQTTQELKKKKKKLHFFIMILRI